MDNKPQPELVIDYTIFGIAFGVASFLLYKWRKNKKIILYAKLPVDSKGLTISKFSVPIPNKIIFALYTSKRKCFTILRFCDPGYLSPLAPQGHEIHPNPE